MDQSKAEPGTAQLIKVGLIGGSGLGEALGAQAGEAQAGGRRHQLDTPFGPPSDAIVETEWAGVPVLLLSRHGPGHLLNPSQVPFRANLHALKQLGCTHVIASGAVGSLREEFRPRDLVIPDQIIDKTHRRAGTFYEHSAVHVEFAEPFCPVLRQVVIEAGKAESQPAGEAPHPSAGEAGRQAGEAFAVHDRGCYVCMEGPAFSTRAESLMHRLWGGDLIGMTAMPEAKLAREAEISYALVALVTDYDCWRQKSAAPGERKAGESPASAAAEVPLDPAVLLKEIIGHLQSASANALRVMRRAVELIAARREALLASPARQALRLAIWSDKARVPREEVRRLSVLWGRHFDAEPAESPTVPSEGPAAEAAVQAVAEAPTAAEVTQAEPGAGAASIAPEDAGAGAGESAEPQAQAPEVDPAPGASRATPEHAESGGGNDPPTA